jgi:hypothetical protein
MELPQNVVPMPAEKREELKRLATAATAGAWQDHALLLEKSDLAQLAKDNDQAAVGLAVDMPNGPRRVVAICGPLSDRASRMTATYIAAVSPDIALATLAYVEHLEAALSKSEGQVKRLSPLVRYMRVELHEAKLIDNREYADLSQLGGSHILDSYDELRTRTEEAEASLSTTTEQLAAARRELAEQEVAALQWAKALAGYSNEISRLRAITEASSARCQDCGQNLPANHQTDFCEACHTEYFFKDPAPKPAAPVLQEGEAGADEWIEVAQKPPFAFVPYIVAALQDEGQNKGKLFTLNRTCLWDSTEKQWVRHGVTPRSVLNREVTHYRELPAPPHVGPPKAQSPPAEPWRAVFDTEAEYDASVKSVAARIASGEVKPIEQAEDSPTYEEVAAAADRAGWGRYMLTREVFDRMSLDMRKLLFADIVSGRLKDKVMNALNFPGGAPLEQKGGVEGE